ncbi:glycoside hydrolase family 25 protein [Jiella marina]|uniref:glycoside hydrolase family 25 protein n=1 Tax=Jiella sp. LLJ827 TaxID=2917712 RepID=UPI0021011E2D|nr:glycoside hydrolase family 25 protein [Jiella sp. LLJ827]MCQ0990232.1 glycoside hydrolase family 25 protein [Jiella sp. LLJ827]
MTKHKAAFAATMRLALILASTLIITGTSSALAAWNEPWKSEDKALVIDAYEFNPIDWEELSSDKRIAGFINKASDGLPPEWSCGKLSGDDYKLCKNRWWKYSVTKELYMTRRQMAKMKGLLWGAYHLGRPGNPREQADHFIEFAEPAEDDLIALDIEDNSEEWMSLEDAEIFADQIKIRTGRYPVLYTNGSTADYIAQNADDYPLLSRLPLWYARYRNDITGKFPEETWPSYALWQFSSMHNCNSRTCPYRVKGAKTDIDVNVASLDHDGLRKAWPFAELIDEAPAAADQLIASVSEETKTKVAAAIPQAAPRKDDTSADPAENPLLAAYGPSGHPVSVDPLKLLTAIAKGDEAAAAEPAKIASKPSVLTDKAARALTAHVSSFQNAVSIAARSLDDLIFTPARAAVTQIEEEEAAIRHRSRVLDVIQSAQAARRANALTMPARVLTQLGADQSDRGGRVRHASADQLAELDTANRRVFSAFEATR